MLYEEDETQKVIKVRVADRVYGDGTAIGQEACYYDLSIKQIISTGECEAILFIRLLQYALNADGSLGALVPGSYRLPLEERLYANNNTAIDPVTQALKYQRVNDTLAFNYETGQNETMPMVEGSPLTDRWKPFLRALPEPYILQGLAFLKMRDEQDVRIRDLITQHIVAANQMGKFSA